MQINPIMKVDCLASSGASCADTQWTAATGRTDRQTGRTSPTRNAALNINGYAAINRRRRRADWPSVRALMADDRETSGSLLGRDETLYRQSLRVWSWPRRINGLHAIGRRRHFPRTTTRSGSARQHCLIT